MTRKYLFLFIIAFLGLGTVVPLSSCSKAAASAGVVTDLTAQGTYDLIQANRSNTDFIIMDVRTPQEYADGHIDQAINIDVNGAGFNSEIANLDKNKEYLVYCRTGNRSQVAVNAMVNMGFKHIYHLTTGITGWTGAGYTTVK